MVTAELPDDVIEAILLFLPVQSLMRFKCVNKSWCALIRSPNFIDQHSSLRPDAILLLLNYCGSHYRRYEQTIGTATPNGGEPSPIPSNILERGPFYLSCCHGLISLHPKNPIHNTFANALKANTFVYNLNTRETLSIPFNANAFKDAKSVRSFIGFEPVSNQYKLMTLGTFGTWPKPVTRCEIITIGGTEDWRQVVTPPIDNESLDWLTDRTDDGWSSQCLNGALHWLTFDSHNIVVFDLESDKSRIIPGPKQIRKGPFTKFRLCQVHGRLTLAKSRIYGAEESFKLWTLKDYYNGVWVKQRIDFYTMKDLLSTPDISRFHIRLVGGIDNDEFLISIWSQLFGYNMKTKQSRKINLRVQHHHSLYIIPYTESMRCY